MRTETVEVSEHIINTYMPYAMTTIIDRALPDIRDGLKPIHRRILYAMYNANLLHDKERAKSTEPIAETMKIHHHGDTSVYDALALMTEQNESLLHPFIDGEGAFGKVYSKDSPSASRYTFCRLNKFGEEFFKDINKDVIKFIGEENHKQPEILLPSYPSILVKNNKGIAVGESCDFPSFNLQEVCDTTIAYIKNKDIDILDYLLSPDFSTGGYLIYDKKALTEIYETGKGSIRLRAKYKYDKENKCIDIYEIPYTTTVDAIVDKITKLMKNNNYKEILDIRDETGFNKNIGKEEMKITIDVRKNCNVELLMQKLFKDSPLESVYSANMNCLVDYKPKVMGIKSILETWLKFRIGYIKKSLTFDITKKSNQLHYLKGLEKILLDIDKAIKIIRYSKSDKLIIENLMLEFNIDNTQANNIANMKLRNINEKFIINKIKSIHDLEQEIIELQSSLNSEEKTKGIIISQLESIKSTYGKPRKTQIIHESKIPEIQEEDFIEDYNCKILYTKQNYIKKLLRSLDEQKLRDGDEILEEIQSTNKSTLLLFTNKANRYKIPCHELETHKPSTLGEYIPNIIDLEEGEEIIKIISLEDETKANGYIISVYENGRIAKIDIQSFISANKKLQNCYSTKSKLIDIIYVEKDINILLLSKEGKGLILNTSYFNAKKSKDSQGDIAINLKSKLEDNKLIGCIFEPNEETNFTINTEKNNIDYCLGNIADTGNKEETRTWYNYLIGKNRNKGNYIYNCKIKKDFIKSIDKHI